MKIDTAIVAVTRVGRSHWGNPTCRLHTADGKAYMTATDSHAGWEAPNYEPRKHWGQRALDVTLHLNHGRVEHIEGPDALALYLGES